MEYVIIAVVAASIVFVIFFIRKKIINKKVLMSSKKIALLLELNEKTEFHQIKDRFVVEKHYDNKSNFTKIEPAYLMAAEIRSNVSYFSDYISKVRENRKMKMAYQKDVQSISFAKYSQDYSQLKLSERTYLQHEEKLFLKRVLSPIVNCEFIVNMSYSSPKGKVNLSKSGRFTFDDLFVCFESVSRSHMDKETYSHLMTAERGEISDSLRYDILRRDNFTCVICGASSKQGALLHVDHIIPISKGGKSVPSNLRTLCERCNIGKSNKIETDSAQSKKAKEDDLICERCGGKLVLRKGKYGEFYGCSNYPRCNFTKKI